MLGSGFCMRRAGVRGRQGLRTAAFASRRVVSFDPRVVFACRARPGRPSLSFVRIPSRRSLAPLIRIRQEVDKRLDPLLPGRSRSEALAGVLDPALTLRIRQSTSGDALRAALATA